MLCGDTGYDVTELKNGRKRNTGARVLSAKFYDLGAKSHTRSEGGDGN